MLPTLLFSCCVFLAITCVGTDFALGRREDCRKHRESREKDVGTVKQHTYYIITSRNNGNLASEQPPKTVSDPVISAKAVHAIQAEGDFERWSFRATGTGASGIVAYAIINKKNGLALGVENGSLNEGARFVLSAYKNSQFQKFMLVPAAEGQCLISALHSGKFLSNDGDPHTAGVSAAITQKTPGNESNQLWQINEVPCDPYPGQPYRLVHRLSGMVLGVRNGSTLTPDFVRLLSINETGDHTRVQFTPVENHTSVYIIHFRHSGKLLDVHGGKKTKTGRLVQYIPSGVGHEQFHIEATFDGWCMLAPLHSRRYVAADWKNDGSYAIGAKVIQLYQTATPEEHFRLELFGFVPEESVSYRIRNRYTDKFLEVNLGSTADLASISENKLSSDSQHQQWFFKRVSDSINTYKIQAKHSKMVLHADTSNDGTPIVQRPPEAGNKQHFMLLESHDSARKEVHHYRIFSVHKQQVLMPIGRSTGDCVGIATVDRNDTDTAQEWELLQEPN